MDVPDRWESPLLATGREYADALSERPDALRTLVDGDLVALEEKLETAGAPWTPGRAIPRWQRTMGN